MLPGSNNKGLMLTVCALKVLGHSFESRRNINHRNHFWLGETEERWRQRLEYETNKQRQQGVYHMGKNSPLYGTGYTQNTTHTVILRRNVKDSMSDSLTCQYRINHTSYVGAKMMQKRAVKKVSVRIQEDRSEDFSCSCKRIRVHATKPFWR